MLIQRLVDKLIRLPSQSFCLISLNKSERATFASNSSVSQSCDLWGHTVSMRQTVNLTLLTSPGAEEAVPGRDI